MKYSVLRFRGFSRGNEKAADHLGMKKTFTYKGIGMTEWLETHPQVEATPEFDAGESWRSKIEVPLTREIAVD
jgi:hypothetical protein